MFSEFSELTDVIRRTSLYFAYTSIFECFEYHDISTYNEKRA